MTHLITFPMPTNMANGRMHWATKVKYHNQWKTRAIVGEKMLRGRRPSRPWQRVRVTAVLHVRQLMDDDNAVSQLKWCLDLLQERGVILNDKRPYCTLTGIPEQRVGSKPTRVELQVEVLE